MFPLNVISVLIQFVSVSLPYYIVLTPIDNLFFHNKFLDETLLTTAGPWQQRLWPRKIFIKNWLFHLLLKRLLVEPKYCLWNKLEKSFIKNIWKNLIPRWPKKSDSFQYCLITTLEFLSIAGVSNFASFFFSMHNKVFRCVNHAAPDCNIFGENCV